ncbi:hypothetical protein G7Y79_00023g053170 [Physcia stellaris]|nr:hypothetical protein G7Y79_00023g053170 [Physcia stellaris]
MGSLRFSEFADSPAMLLSSYQHSFDPVASYYPSLQHFPSPKLVAPIDPSQKFHFQSTLTSASPVAIAPSKKRKRGSFDKEPTFASPSLHSLASASQPTANPVALPEDETALSNSNEHDSCPFTGETIDPLANTSPSDLDAPSSRQKFRRRETADTLSLSTINNTIVPTTPNSRTQEQSVDQITHLLGVGWTRISSNPDPDAQKATRGWEKYIENHYPLTSVAILATSKALDGAFLTLARDYENMALRRFLLFSEDLTEGRLLASSWDTCLMRLQAQPMVFESEDVLRAARTPDLTPTSVAGGEVGEGVVDLEGLSAEGGLDDVMVCD